MTSSATVVYYDQVLVEDLVLRCVAGAGGLSTQHNEVGFLWEGERGGLRQGGEAPVARGIKTRTWSHGTALARHNVIVIHALSLERGLAQYQRSCTARLACAISSS